MLGIFQRATANHIWHLTRPDNRHNKLVRDTLNDLADHGMVRREMKLSGNQDLWVLTRAGHREARSLLPPEVRLSALREANGAPGYHEHAVAVTSTAAALARAGFGTLLSWQTEVGHKLPGGYVQYTDLVMRAPQAGVPVMLIEVDRVTEPVQMLADKLDRYREWFQLPIRRAGKKARSTDSAGAGAHRHRLWTRVYPPTGREGFPPVAFVFTDATETRMLNRAEQLRQKTSRYWSGSPYGGGGGTARNYHAAIPVVITTLPRLLEHGVGGRVWWRFGHSSWQTLTAALDNVDGDQLLAVENERAAVVRAERARIEREQRRPVCARCGAKFTDERWKNVKQYPRNGGKDLCAGCWKEDLARQRMEHEAAQAAREAAAQAAAEASQPGPRKRDLFRRRRT